MSELLEQPPKPHAYLVAGGGGGMRSTIILRLFAQELGARDIPYTSVEGVSGCGDEQMVNHPSLQMQDMEASIAKHPEDTPLLFVSHCVGTIAALGALEKVDGARPASLVAVAPPLPSPRDTILTPQSQKKRSENDTLMRVVDLPEGAVDYSVMTESVARIDPQYFTDIFAADSLETHLRTKVETGSATVYAPEHDWNTGSPLRVQDWHDGWSATLPPEEAETLQARAPILRDAAHGLYISPRTGRDVSTEENVAFQLSNINHAIDAGLGLLADPKPVSV